MAFLEGFNLPGIVIESDGEKEAQHDDCVALKVSDCVFVVRFDHG